MTFKTKIIAGAALIAASMIDADAMNNMPLIQNGAQGVAVHLILQADHPHVNHAINAGGHINDGIVVFLVNQGIDMNNGFMFVAINNALDAMHHANNNADDVRIDTPETTR